MKKLLSLIAVLSLVLGLATVAAATDTTDQTMWDTSIFEVPADLNEVHEDWSNDYEGLECWEPIGLGIYHYVKGGVNFYRWLDKMEKVPDCTDGAGCLSIVTSGLETIVFWNGVPNLSKNLFKWVEGKTKDVYIPDSVTEIAENCFVEGSHITLHFTANNKTALAYAQSRGMAFEVMDAKERLPGDANFDKSADMKDVLTLRRFIAHIPTAYEIYSTDLTCDKSTDMKDVLCLRQQIAVTVEYYE